MAAIWQSFLANLLQELWRQIAVRVLFDRWINEFDLAPNKMMKPNQKHMLHLLDLLSLKLLYPLHSLFQIPALKIPRWAASARHLLFFNLGHFDILHLFLHNLVVLLYRFIGITWILLQHQYQLLEIVLWSLMVETLEGALVRLGVVLSRFIRLLGELFQFVEAAEQVQIVYRVAGWLQLGTDGL